LGCERLLPGASCCAVHGRPGQLNSCQLSIAARQNSDRRIRSRRPGPQATCINADDQFRNLGLLHLARYQNPGAERRMRIEVSSPTPGTLSSVKSQHQPPEWPSCPTLSNNPIWAQHRRRIADPTVSLPRPLLHSPVRARSAERGSKFLMAGSKDPSRPRPACRECRLSSRPVTNSPDCGRPLQPSARLGMGPATSGDPQGARWFALIL
jgi:hypothetical protein